MLQHKHRTFISFDGACPFRCKHCYTYSINNNEQQRSIEEILDDIENEEFDIIYISQKNENFSNPNKGIELCEKAYERYHKDIIIITRSVFDDSQMNRLYVLHNQMKKERRNLIVAVSFISLNRANVSERLDIIPSPEQRIDFLCKLYNLNIPNFALIRPLFPQAIIPIDDIYGLIDRCKDYVDCIVTSELGVNSDIESRLGINFNSFCSYKSSQYLNGAINEELRFLKLDDELKLISEKCRDSKIMFFTHSMQAINFICQGGKGYGENGN